MDKQLLANKLKTICTAERACTYCDRQVKGEYIECRAYHMGTRSQHFRHTCKLCGFVVFDGSDRQQPHRRPQAVGELKDLRTGPGRRRTRAVQSPAGIFASLTEMSQHYGKNPSTMTYWMRTRPTEFYYVS
jgi:hypothetical protein